MPQTKKTLRLTIDEKGAISSLNKLNKSLDKSEKKGKKTASEMSKNFDDVKKRVSSLRISVLGLAGVLGFGFLIKQSIDVSRRFSKLDTSLKAVTQTSERYDKAIKIINETTAKLPSILEEVTTAYVRMESLGLSPTEDALISFTNTSIAMGKDLEQFIEAVADAATFEFERLKEFGIKSRTEAESISFTFQGATTTVGKSAEEVIGFLESIGNTTFSGAAAKQLGTLDGQLIKFADSFTFIAKTFGDSLAPGVSLLTEELQDLTNNMDPATIQEFGRNFTVSVGEMLVATGNLVGVVESNPEIVSSGILGYILLGKKGLAAGALFGASIDGLRQLAGIAGDFIGDIENNLNDVNNLGNSIDLNNFEATVSEAGDKVAEIFGVKTQENASEFSAKIVEVGDRLIELGNKPIDIVMNIKTPEVTNIGNVNELNPESNALISLRKQLLTEEELLIESTTAKFEIISKSLEGKQLLQSDAALLEQEIAANHQDKLTSIINKGTDDQRKFSIMSARDQFKNVSQFLAATTASAARENKKFFLINKIASISSATISTYEAVNKTLAAYPSPLNFALAGVVGAAGFANVASIAGTSFGTGGSGSVTVPSGGTISSLPTVPSDLLPDNIDDQRPDVIVNITITDPTDTVIAELSERINSNGEIIISPESQNARVILGAT